MSPSKETDLLDSPQVVTERQPKVAGAGFLDPMGRVASTRWFRWVALLLLVIATAVSHYQETIGG